MSESPRSVDQGGPATTRTGRRAALAALLVAEAMNLLDVTIVQVAAPTMHRELGGSVADVQWFGAAYTLPFAVLLLTGGRLGDRYGRRRVFRVGVAAFGVGSLACACAPSAGVLIGLRAVQGAAAALVIPQTIGLIKAMFSGPEVPRALGAIGPVMGLAAILGPVLGAVLTHADLLGSSWRSVFLVNVPLTVVVLVIAPALVEDRSPRRPALDPAGTVLAAVGTFLVVLPVVESSTAPIGWGRVGAGVALLTGFGLHQWISARAGRSPLVEISLFAGRVFPAALLVSAMFFLVTQGLTLVVVLQMQLGRGADVLVAGLTLVPWSVGLAAGSWIAGAHLVRRFGGRVMYAGLVVMLVGLGGALLGYSAGGVVGYLVLLAGLAVVGLGAGLFSPAFFSAALAVVRPPEVGSAAGLLNAVQQMGATLGTAVLGAVYVGGRGAGPGVGARAADLHAVRLAFEVAAALVVLILPVSALLVRPVRLSIDD